jgi:Tartrate dehydratase alpha subunit/Fumarate hydratase class I, N-terminal domain
MSATTFPTTENPPSSAASQLQVSLLELIRRTSTILPDDVVNVIEAARKTETKGSNADVALEVIGCNIGLAKDKSAPICQDTGSILFFVHTPVGYDQITFEEAATQAVREATKIGCLRQNSVDSITGKNTGDNTGPGSPVFHFSQ